MAIKKCAVCGKEFIDFGRGKYCKGPHYIECQVCRKQFEYNPALPIPKTCSHKCGSTLGMTKAKFKPKQCIKCGDTFIPNCGAQKHCLKCSNSE